MARRPIRIANASGAIGDGIDQVLRLATSIPTPDAITADYLAEFNIAWRAVELRSAPHLGYEPNFLDQLSWKNGAGARAISDKKIKVVHDGGALNPKGLAAKVDQMFSNLGIRGMKIAWVEGDNVTDEVRRGEMGVVRHLDKDEIFDPSGEDVLAANIYTGQAGIIKALEEGADIVICGRCCDASPVTALSTWWHGWKPTDYNPLAGSLMAGHLIECGGYVTGGNYCGQDELPLSALHNIGYPIAEIAADGTSVITKPEGSSGIVSMDTCKAQLLYEIQGQYYLNPDVTATISRAKLESVGKNRIRLSGIEGLPPPPTLKLAICLHAGYQAELSAYLTSPSIERKFELLKSQVFKYINPDDFLVFDISKYGSAPTDPKSQKECTVQIRMFAQAKTKEAFEQFKRAIFYNGMQGYAGLHLGMDWRTMMPKDFVKYFPALVEREKLGGMKVSFVTGENFHVPQEPPSETYRIERSQQSFACDQSKMKALASSWSRTVKRPLGDLLFARSGDKGGNANIGFWVRNSEAYPWLLSFLTSERLITLLGDDWDESYAIEQCDFPGLQAVNFLIRGILQEGVSSSTVLDGFGKSIAEFVRSRVVDLPMELVEEEDERRRNNLEVATREASRL